MCWYFSLWCCPELFGTGLLNIRKWLCNGFIIVALISLLHTHRHKHPHPRKHSLAKPLLYSTMQIRWIISAAEIKSPIHLNSLILGQKLTSESDHRWQICLTVSRAIPFEIKLQSSGHHQRHQQPDMNVSDGSVTFARRNLRIYSARRRHFSKRLLRADNFSGGLDSNRTKSDLTRIKSNRTWLESNRIEANRTWIESNRIGLESSRIESDLTRIQSNRIEYLHGFYLNSQYCAFAWSWQR